MQEGGSMDQRLENRGLRASTLSLVVKKDFKYLGPYISFTEKDIVARKAQAWSTLHNAGALRIFGVHQARRPQKGYYNSNSGPR